MKRRERRDFEGIPRNTHSLALFTLPLNFSASVSAGFHLIVPEESYLFEGKMQLSRGRAKG